MGDARWRTLDDGTDAGGYLVPPAMGGLVEMVTALDAYGNGDWCGECRYGVVEDPPCCEGGEKP